VVAQNPDPVTGVPQYSFSHTAAGADYDAGVIPDGSCNGCHIPPAPSELGPPLAVHSTVGTYDSSEEDPEDRCDVDQRYAEALGKEFVYEIVSATDGASGDANDDEDGVLEPGEVPRITFRVKDSQGNAYDILNDPEFTDPGAALNLYVAWIAADIYNGDENGWSGGYRDRNNGNQPEYYGAGHPDRMYLSAIQRDAVNTGGNTFRVDYFMALPEDITGDPVIAMGGHPVAQDVALEDVDSGNVVMWDCEAAPTSAIFYPGFVRETAYTPDNCNACHKHLQFHGGNRNGNTEMCLVCHNADLTDGDEGFAFGRMVHSIHSASTTFDGGRFMDVTYPQPVANCETCHKPESYNSARFAARAVSTAQGAEEDSWLDDIATTPTAAACGVCHSDQGAKNHFVTVGGAQVDETKENIVGALANPTGQEGCIVCHGPGSIYDAALFHNPGVED
jgi:OmcA/MtrC family decaheme c-type cytochrome